MAEVALVIPAFDYIIVDPTQRKYATYKVIGWDEPSITEYVTNKKNHEKIASFITKTVSFSASSRRNRFYEIYNRPAMLDLEEIYEGAVDSIKLLSELYEIYIITDRTEDLESATIDSLNNHGFPVENVHIYFKKIHDSMHVYKRTILREITQKYLKGVAIITHPKDNHLFGLFDYTVLGFDSIVKETEFSHSVERICHNWKQICSTLKRE
jgi:hypothetical protein